MIESSTMEKWNMDQNPGTDSPTPCTLLVTTTAWYTWPWSSLGQASSSPTTASCGLLPDSLPLHHHCLRYQPRLHPHCSHCPSQQCPHLYIFSEQQNHVWLHSLLPCPHVHPCLHHLAGHVLYWPELCHHPSLCCSHICWSNRSAARIIAATIYWWILFQSSNPPSTGWQACSRLGTPRQSWREKVRSQQLFNHNNFCYQGLAGLLVSISRILTKSFVSSKKSSTVVFFTISIVIIITCMYTYIKVGHCLSRKHRVINLEVKLTNT